MGESPVFRKNGVSIVPQMFPENRKNQTAAAELLGKLLVDAEINGNFVLKFDKSIPGSSAKKGIAIVPQQNLGIPLTIQPGDNGTCGKYCLMIQWVGDKRSTTENVAVLHARLTTALREREEKTHSSAKRQLDELFVGGPVDLGQFEPVPSVHAELTPTREELTANVSEQERVQFNCKENVDLLLSYLVEKSPDRVFTAGDLYVVLVEHFGYKPEERRRMFHVTGLLVRLKRVENLGAARFRILTDDEYSESARDIAKVEAFLKELSTMREKVSQIDAELETSHSELREVESALAPLRKRHDELTKRITGLQHAKEREKLTKLEKRFKSIKRSFRE